MEQPHQMGPCYASFHRPSLQKTTFLIAPSIEAQECLVNEILSDVTKTVMGREKPLAEMQILFTLFFQNWQTDKRIDKQ